jgi:hypothetical protein
VRVDEGLATQGPHPAHPSLPSSPRSARAQASADNVGFRQAGVASPRSATFRGTRITPTARCLAADALALPCGCRAFWGRGPGRRASAVDGPFCARPLAASPGRPLPPGGHRREEEPFQPDRVCARLEAHHERAHHPLQRPHDGRRLTPRTVTPAYTQDRTVPADQGAVRLGGGLAAAHVVAGSRGSRLVPSLRAAVKWAGPSAARARRVMRSTSVRRPEGAARRLRCGQPRLRRAPRRRARGSR